MKFDPRYIIEDDDPDLIWRFTRYVSEVIRYAALEYDRNQKHEKHELPLDAFPPELFSYEDPQPRLDGFAFEEDKLSEAFASQSMLRKES